MSGCIEFFAYRWVLRARICNNVEGKLLTIDWYRVKARRLHLQSKKTGFLSKLRNDRVQSTTTVKPPSRQKMLLFFYDIPRQKETFDGNFFLRIAAISSNKVHSDATICYAVCVPNRDRVSSFTVNDEKNRA